AFVVDVDADGLVQAQQVYGATGKRSDLMGIARSGNTYVAIGTQYDGPFDPSTTNCNPDGGYSCPWGDVAVIRLGSTLPPTPLAQTLLTNTSGEQDTGMDVTFAGDGTVFASAILDCDGLGQLGGCFRFGEGGAGEGVVYKLNPSNLSLH